MLRIATLNQNQPVMSNDDLSNVGQPVPGKDESYYHVWDSLRDWGQRLYRKADVAFLQEVRHEPHVQFLAQPNISGLRYYVVMQQEQSRIADLAILSRYPLGVVQQISVGVNNILAATTIIEDIPHLLINVHWEANTAYNATSPSRRESAERVVSLSRAANLANMPTFVGGDLNTISGNGPEGIGGYVPSEYVILSSALFDSYIYTLPQAIHCSDKRIDYIFFKGDYEMIEYSACLGNGKLALLSDHPCVIVSLKKRGVTQLQVKSHAPVTAVSPNTDELLVTSITEENIEKGYVIDAYWAPNLGVWRGWQRLESAPPETFMGSAIEDNRAYVFWVGSDGWILHKWRGPDGRWSNTSRVGSSDIPRLNGQPGGAVHVVSCQPGMLYVFYTNREGRIVGARQNTEAGGIWTEHGEILSGRTLPGGHVSAVSRRPGQIDIFTVGTDGGVYTAAWNLHDDWRGWWIIGGLTARPGTYIGAVSRRLDHLDIFLADLDGRTMSAAWEPASGWRGWWHIQSGRTCSGGYVTAVSRSTDKLDIFTTGLDWLVYTAAWEPASGWRGWWPINNATAKTPIWPVSRSTDKLDIFFVAPDGRIQTAAWEPGRTWGGPWTIN